MTRCSGRGGIMCNLIHHNIIKMQYILTMLLWILKCNHGIVMIYQILHSKVFTLSTYNQSACKINFKIIQFMTMNSYKGSNNHFLTNNAV